MSINKNIAILFACTICFISNTLFATSTSSSLISEYDIQKKKKSSRYIFFSAGSTGFLGASKGVGEISKGGTAADSGGVINAVFSTSSGYFFGLSLEVIIPNDGLLLSAPIPVESPTHFYKDTVKVPKEAVTSSSTEKYHLCYDNDTIVTAPVSTASLQLYLRVGGPISITSSTKGRTKGLYFFTDYGCREMIFRTSSRALLQKIAGISPKSLMLYHREFDWVSLIVGAGIAYMIQTEKYSLSLIGYIHNPLPVIIASARSKQTIRFAAKHIETTSGTGADITAATYRDATDLKNITYLKQNTLSPRLGNDELIDHSMRSLPSFHCTIPFEYKITSYITVGAAFDMRYTFILSKDEDDTVVKPFMSLFGIGCQIGLGIIL